MGLADQAASGGDDWRRSLILGVSHCPHLVDQLVWDNGGEMSLAWMADGCGGGLVSGGGIGGVSHSPLLSSLLSRSLSRLSHLFFEFLGINSTRVALMPNSSDFSKLFILV